MGTIKIELSKDNTLSLLGLLELLKIDYKKSNNQDILNVIQEIKIEIASQMKV